MVITKDACDVIPVATVWAALRAIPDPEIPVISITDLGIVRDVASTIDGLTIIVTPTYTGCPATEVIKADIAAAMRTLGAPRIEILIQLTPPWTTDWLTPEAKAALMRYGIAPPDRRGADYVRPLAFKPRCPRCASLNTEQLSRFGATPCKSLHRCCECREPFEYFKPH